jgi:hypothetical protein
VLDFFGLKHEPGLKKPGDFKVSKGHRYPLVVANYVPILNTHFSFVFSAALPYVPEETCFQQVGPSVVEGKQEEEGTIQPVTIS